jgi:hypothetical protein
MKAKVKATGKVIILNEKVSLIDYARGFYRDTEGNKYHYNEIEIFESEYEKPIDWEQRRYELAKELMKGFAANPHNKCVDATTETLAQWSVGGADALIAELKKGGMK